MKTKPGNLSRELWLEPILEKKESIFFIWDFTKSDRLKVSTINFEEMCLEVARIYMRLEELTGFR